ncbi:MAG: Ig-like domain-containing protein [Planctomycetota bacterium]|nr:Ig-like domain-containing protein [Planctomycetota bacterium]
MRPRTATRTAARLFTGALLALLLLPGATCSTGNPSVIFDPENPGGGGDGGGGGTPPKPDGPAAAPVDGALYVDGRPSLTAMAPRSGSFGVDVLAVIALWFRESLQPDTVTPQTMVLRPVGIGNSGAVQVGYSTTWLAGNRCVVLQPGVPLLPNTLYEVVANDEVLDLDGKRLIVSETGVLGSFRTSPQSSGLAPRVLGSFPPSGAINQPNDHSVILVFSKPMDFTGISSAVHLRNLDEGGLADYDTSADVEFRHAGNRVFEFPHREDARDLFAEVRLSVDPTLTDLDFFPQPLAAGHFATWKTLGFARPSMIAPFDDDPNDPFAPAINGNNFDDFPVDVVTGVSAQSSDFVTLIAHDASSASSRRETRLAGSGAPRFRMDLSEKGASLFPSATEVVLAAFLKRGPFRSTVQVARTPSGEPAVVIVDSNPPLLTTFGPPVGTFGSQFLSDAPELRPYGRATEAVGRVRVRFPAGTTAKTRNVFDPPSSGFFAGPAFTLPTVGAGPFPFDVLLTDTAGNAAPVAIPATATFRGFVGPIPLGSGSMKVSAYDQTTLAPVPNAKVYIETFGGGSESSGLTGSDGSITFTGRTAAQTVTIVADGRQSITVVGVAATELSLPMAETVVALADLGVGITGVSTGITTVSGSLLAEDDGLEDADLVQTVDLEVFFGAGVTARFQRPGWFAAFHEVESFPAIGSYFRFFALDPAVITEPSAGGNLQSPVLPLGESSNEVLAATDFQYPVSVTLGGGYDLPTDSAGAIAFARVPGLDHLAAIGAGSVVGASGAAEVEIVLHAAAVEAGATPGEVLIQAFGVDDDGDFALARAAVALAATPGTAALTFPGIPEVTGAWTGASYPFTRSFTSTLAAGTGFYRIVIRDNAVPPNSWKLWIPATSGLGGSMTLPTLKDSPSGAIGTPPLASSPGSVWRAFAEAYLMPGSFLEIGFFWTSLRRDCTGFARSVVGPGLAF